MKKKNIYILLAFSLVSLIISWPPIQNTGFFLLFGFTPILILIDSHTKSKKNEISIRRLLFLIFCAYSIWNIWAVYWVFVSLYNSGLSIITSLGISLVPYFLEPILLITVLYIFYRFRKHYSLLTSLTLWMVLMILNEQLKLNWDLKFPWMNLSNGFSDTIWAVQWISFTGDIGISLWILLSNISMVFVIQNTKEKKYWYMTGATLLLPILFSVILYYQPREQGEKVEVVIVQPNVDPHLKYNTISKKKQIEELLTLPAKYLTPNTRFLLYPETAYQSSINQKDTHLDYIFQDFRNIIAQYPNLNIICGTESHNIFDQKVDPSTIKLSDNRYYNFYNSVFYMTQGQPIQFYNKSKMVPGVEMMPFSFIFSKLAFLFETFGGASSSYTEGKKHNNLENSKYKITSIVCYDTLWGELVRNLVDKGGQFISIHTNDGWWGNTKGKDQLLSYAKLRAVECSRYVVRSANTGISAIINPRGEVILRGNWWVKEVMKGELELLKEKTFYVKTGNNWLIYLLAAITCFLFIKERISRN